MNTSKLNLMFFLALAMFCCHELDAVSKLEWRLLPGLNLLDDSTALKVFVLAHIPLFTAVFWLCSHQNKAIARKSRFYVCLLLSIHGIAHLIFDAINHVEYRFEAPLDLFTVYGAALTSIVYLLLDRKAIDVDHSKA